jgi:hypothetical protein
MQPITEKQKTKLWAASREIGMDDVGLHDLVRGCTGKESIRELSKAEAIFVIDELVKMGARKGRRKTRPESKDTLPVNIPRLRSAIQAAKIQNLIEALGWGPKGLRKFALRVIKRETIRTSQEAGKLIEALNAIHERTMQKRIIQRVDSW